MKDAPDLAQCRMIEVMAGVGVPEGDITRVFGIDLATLRDRHRVELETGQIIANAKVAESLLRKAIGDFAASRGAEILARLTGATLVIRSRRQGRCRSAKMPFAPILRPWNSNGNQRRDQA